MVVIGLFSSWAAVLKNWGSTFGADERVIDVAKRDVVNVGDDPIVEASIMTLESAHGVLDTASMDLD